MQAERDEREKAALQVLVVHHSTHRLVFLNYAKLHLLRTCQRVHL